MILDENNLNSKLQVQLIGLGLLATLSFTLLGCAKAVQSEVNQAKGSSEAKYQPAVNVGTKGKKMNKIEYTVSTSGLKFKDEQSGSGAEAQAGKNVSVHYTGTFYPSGEKFDSSLDRGQPFQFKLGARQVIKGWDEGVAGMKVGGKRILIIPPDLAYGSNGIPGAIPPNSTLMFEVELLGVN